MTETGIVAAINAAAANVAVDIGTTTVVVELVESDNAGVSRDTPDKIAGASTARPLFVATAINAQRLYGADVITRINYCAKKGHEKLTTAIREQIAELIINVGKMLASSDSECRLKNVETNSVRSLQIKNITITGNTIMQHLAAGYSPVSMGVVPFTTVSLFGTETAIWDELKPLVSEDANIYYAPAISAYVGGDVTTGILAVEEKLNFCSTATEGRNQGLKTYLLIDIGTNGEIVLKHGDKFYCCATAAGPAFEGAGIKKGMAAVSGAVNHANWDDSQEKLNLEVIGDTEPKGICGSGLLDILAYLLSEDIVDETGRMFLERSPEPDKYYLTENVFITSDDIRNIQLAKAAIAAGVQTLFHHANITENQIEALFLAGNFGTYLNKNSAARIGLIPNKLLPITQAVGNAALDGAVLTLIDKDAREKLENIRNSCEYVELSANKIFNEQFVEQMMFQVYLVI